MLARDLLTKMRRSLPLSAAEIKFLVQGIADQSLSDAQVAAFAMAICKDGMDEAGRATLTKAMCQSGLELQWDVPGPIVDKHSTGGVGDAVSLVLAPVLAACGAYVPMISGRGLGHTGGTLDKLEAIPGVKVAQPIEEAQRILRTHGAFIISASAQIAPADRRLYAIRDVTGTVDSVDLITGSILSKKMAAGLDHLILDVKCGTGAWMKNLDEARDLACALVQTGRHLGNSVHAVISRMDAPLIPAIGNALEIKEVINVLRAGEDALLHPLAQLAQKLGAELLLAAKIVPDQAAAMALFAQKLASGEGLEKFASICVAQGGPNGFVDNPTRYLPEAPVIIEVKAAHSGYITAMQAETMGKTVVQLGGGRKHAADHIDPAVGLCDILSMGAQVQRGDVLARIHAARLDDAEAAQKSIENAIAIDEPLIPEQPLILEKI